MADYLSFNSNRRLGVEIELNSFDNRDFKKKPLMRGEFPEGVNYIANLIFNKLKLAVKVTKWGATHDNETWVVKPDSSCGIEICSPVVRGWRGIKEICKVITLLRNDSNVIFDDRCSFHVHVNVEDCTEEELASIVTYWIKSEAVFLDSVPVNRKRNRYCQQIGITDLFSHNTPLQASSIIKKIGDSKYYTLNTYHLNKKDRPTIEFRIIEGAGCVNPYLVKNWIRLLIHFVETTKNTNLPSLYEYDDPWSSFLWLDPKEVMQLLKFDGVYSLSNGMTETKNWFLARLKNNLDFEENGKLGVLSRKARSIALNQVDELIKGSHLTKEQIKCYLEPEDMKQAVFSIKNKI